jgi:hypothetical protein
MERKFYDKNVFEVLTYFDILNNTILNKDLNTGMFGPYKEEQILTEENVVNFSIKKVRRIADNLIFSIGDKVQTPATGSVITKMEFNDAEKEEDTGINLTFEDGTGDFLEDIVGFATDEQIAAKKANWDSINNDLSSLMKGYGGIDEEGKGESTDTGFNDHMDQLKNWMNQYKKPPQQ